MNYKQKLEKLQATVTQAIADLETGLEESQSSSPSEATDSFDNGNVWKPVSDSGTLVVILKESYNANTVTVKTKDGSYEDLRYTGRANGNRQHWRGIYPGSRYAGMRLGGGVTVEEGNLTTWIPLKDKPKNRQD